MPTDHRAALANIKRFDQLIAYLRDEMGWPIARDSFEDVDDLFYDFTADELGIDPKTAAKITEIKRLKPLSTRQPWGIFFVKFEPKKLPVVALRRILSQVALKKRASANSAERTAWAADDLLFVSNYGEGDERQISFAHFSQAETKHDLPTLKVLGWDNRDTALHLDAVAKELTQHLAWPDDDANVEAWRKGWRGAFTLRHGEVVTTSKELSIRLAKLAGDIRDRIKSALAIETDRGPLTKLMKAFQTSLVHDLDADGFADMYAQTIAYGLLSARIADPHKKTVDDFAGHMRTNPFLRELMETFLKVGGRRGKAGGPGIDFDELGVSEVVQLLDDANMEAVVLDFGDKNPQEDPVIHFYELFLKEYDAKKRMQRGVFYTPRPVVSYIVRSVDELLRGEFGLEDGLADTTTWGEMAKRHKDLKIPDGTLPDQPFVQILDPATGTGTFLVEVIDIIHKTLVAKWKAQGHGEKKIALLWNDYVPRYLLTRLHAYELLMAPYAIAHLKVGLKLHETGYYFGSDERARIYLTNALEPASDKQLTLDFLPALAHEAQAVNEIKGNQRFTIVIGNPPYFGEAGRGGDWIARLMRGIDPDGSGKTESYFQADGQALQERTTKWLNDDYVKFIRLAEWLIDRAGAGVLGFVTNHSYIDNPTFRGMRESLLRSFRTIRILDLHGNANKKETSPHGATDANVFDILQGVAIAIMSKATRADVTRRVTHAELWGSREEKYSALMDARCVARAERAIVAGAPSFYFVPEDSERRSEYEAGWSIASIFPVHGVGMTTARDDMVIDFDKAPLLERATLFRDSKASNSELCTMLKIPEKKGWNVSRSRQLIREETDLPCHIRPILYRPFDVRLIFYHDSLVWRTVKAVMSHMLAGNNIGLITTRQTKDAWGVTATRHIIGHKTCAAYDVNSLFPLYANPPPSETLFGDRGGNVKPDKEGRTPNLSSEFIAAFSAAMGLSFVHGRPGDKHSFDAEDVFRYAYAIFHSPKYRSRYSEFLKSDFPRLPLPGSVEVFRNLVHLGSDLVALHVMESPNLDHFITTYFGSENPEVGRVGWSDDTVWLDTAPAKRGHAPTASTNGFRGVPEAVWNLHIGGYQVCEKWLKDRKGRTLSKDDIADYQKIVVALVETIRLMKEIDKVIDRYGGWPGAFSAPYGSSEMPTRKAAEPRAPTYK